VRAEQAVGAAPRPGARADRRLFILRHSAAIRVMHWVNFITLTIMLMSGLQIFNAHPALYWGATSHFSRPLLSITNGFPSWATLPGGFWLAMGRLWHLFFAWILVLNGAAYVLLGLVTGHLRRDLWLTPREWRGLGHTFLEHLRLRFAHGDEARRYNGLQKLAYLSVIFLVGPLIVLTGLTMSPTMDAGFPWLLWLFHGRQSARTIHFVCAMMLLGFFLVHIAMVILSGLWNNLRSMITGRYAIETTAAATTESHHE
jgi:thiosulfate reductase cytochrome b subunit